MPGIFHSPWASIGSTSSLCENFGDSVRLKAYHVPKQCGLFALHLLGRLLVMEAQIFRVEGSLFTVMRISRPFYSLNSYSVPYCNLPYIEQV